MGSAYKEYCRLESQYYLFDLDPPDYQRNYWNLIGLLWLRKEVKTTIKDYWKNFKKEWPNEKTPE